MTAGRLEKINDDIRQIHRLTDAVGDEHDGGIGLGTDIEQADPAFPCASVRRARRTVRPSAAVSARAPTRDRARRAAACRPRAAMDRSPRNPCKPTSFRRSKARCLTFGPRLAPQLHGEQHVFQHRSPGHQVRLLKRHTEIIVRLGDLDAVDLHGATAGADETPDDFQEGGLAATAGPQKADQGPLP